MKKTLEETEADVQNAIETSKKVLLALKEINLLLFKRGVKTVDFTHWANIFWFEVTNRDDLRDLLSLCPVWDKVPTGTGFHYIAKYNEVTIYINAIEDALPPTCRIITEEVLVPEHTTKRTRIVCDDQTAKQNADRESVQAL